jgi:Replication initiation factor
VPTRSIQDGCVVGAGVDYIAASAQIRSGELALIAIGEAAIRDAKRDGNIVRTFSANGYRGTTCGGASLGSGDGGSIVRISGARAATVCRGIIDVADNVSRIDLQATVRFDRDIHALARQHAAELRREQRTRERQLHTRLERTFGRGDTLYVGSRSSNYYGRVYDKHRESGSDEYAKCWRYEIECKNDAATVAARLITNMDNHPAPIAAAVYRWYGDRGVQCRFAPDAPVELSQIGRPETDMQGQLRWLHRQVAPVVRRLLGVYSESDLYGVLFGGLDPTGLQPLDTKEEDGESAYEAWTVSERVRSSIESAKQNGRGWNHA